MRRVAYFVSIQSKDLNHCTTRFFATEPQNDKTIPYSLFPAPHTRRITPAFCGLDLNTFTLRIADENIQKPFTWHNYDKIQVQAMTETSNSMLSNREPGVVETGWKQVNENPSRAAR